MELNFEGALRAGVVGAAGGYQAVVMGDIADSRKQRQEQAQMEREQNLIQYRQKVSDDAWKKRDDYTTSQIGAKATATAKAQQGIYNTPEAAGIRQDKEDSAIRVAGAKESAKISSRQQGMVADIEFLRGKGYTEQQIQDAVMKKHFNQGRDTAKDKRSTGLLTQNQEYTITKDIRERVDEEMGPEPKINKGSWLPGDTESKADFKIRQENYKADKLLYENTLRQEAGVKTKAPKGKANIAAYEKAILRQQEETQGQRTSRGGAVVAQDSQGRPVGSQSQADSMYMNDAAARDVLAQSRQGVRVQQQSQPTGEFVRMDKKDGMNYARNLAGNLKAQEQVLAKIHPSDRQAQRTRFNQANAELQRKQGRN